MTGWTVKPTSRSGWRRMREQAPLGQDGRVRKGVGEAGHPTAASTAGCSFPFRRSASRSVPGELEEDVVEGGAAHGDVVDADARLVEPPDGVRDRPLARAEGNAQKPVDAGGLLLGDRPERRDRLVAGTAVAELDLQPLAADLPLELVRCALGDHDAVVDDRDPFGEPVCLVQVLRGQEHRRALVDESLDGLPERHPARQVEAGGRLVEEEDGRPRDEGGGEVEAAPHAARVRAYEPLARVLEAEVDQ